MSARRRRSTVPECLVLQHWCGAVVVRPWSTVGMWCPRCARLTASGGWLPTMPPRHRRAALPWAVWLLLIMVAVSGSSWIAR